MTSDTFQHVQEQAKQIVRRYNISPELREQYVQEAPGEVYIAMCKMQMLGREVDDVPAFTASVVRNSLLNKQRVKRHEELQGELVSQQEPGAMEIKDLIERLAIKAKSQRPELVQAILVFKMVGFSHQEIAQLVGCSEKTVSRVLQRVS